MKAVTCENKAANKKKRMRLNEKGKKTTSLHTRWMANIRAHTYIYTHAHSLLHTQNDSKLMPMHYIVKWSEMKWMEMESIAKQNRGRMEQKKISK